ncbi:MAG: hypothetical protein WBB19_11770 [Desulforhopalus sp.]
MLKRTVKYGGVLVAAFVTALVFPVLSSGDDIGQDWYCSEPEAHAQYEKHLKTHLDHEADAITNRLEKIFSDSSLTAEQKHSKTLSVLNKYLSRIKAGVGD